MRTATKFLCAVASIALPGATPAAAQSVDNIVAFGDSYADDGNFFQLIGIAPPLAYPDGRFSNRTNFVDTMSQILNVPVDNFAIGGAFTGPGNTGIHNINDNPAAPLGIPGFQAEIGSFLAGGGPAAFPRVSGSFDANDLVVVSIGGNDARFYQFSGGTVAGAPAAAAISVAEATGGLNALVNAGARNITFLAGDVGRLPEVRGTPVAAIGSAFATSFNNGMQASLADMAADGVIVNYLDLNKIGDVVEANLSAFGLTSAGACPIACATTDPALADKFLFYVDQIHLTAAGFAIVGRYAVRQLEAPLHFQAQTDVGLETARAFGSTLLGRLDLSDARRDADTEDGLSFYVTGSFAGRNYERSATNLEYDVDAPGVTAGVEYNLGNGAMLGAAANYTRAKAKAVIGNGTARAEAWQAGLYGGWAGAGGAFIEGYAGYGWLDLDTGRDAVIDRIRGETDGHAVTAGAKAGYLFGLGGVKLGPVIGLHYAKAELDGYTETGDPVLTLNVDDQDVKALVGSAGIEARATWDVGGLAVTPYATVAAEKDFEGDGRVIRYAGTAAPTIVNSFVLPDRSKDAYVRLGGGVNFALGGGLALQVNGTATVSQDGGDDFAGFAGLKLGF